MSHSDSTRNCLRVTPYQRRSNLYSSSSMSSKRWLFSRTLNPRHPVRHISPGGMENAGITLTCPGYCRSRRERQRAIYSCSITHAPGSNLHSALEAPLSNRSRHSQPSSITVWAAAIFMDSMGRRPHSTYMEVDYFFFFYMEVDYSDITQFLSRHPRIVRPKRLSTHSHKTFSQSLSLQSLPEPTHLQVISTKSVSLNHAKYSAAPDQSVRREPDH